MPNGWNTAGALAVRVDDPTGHELWTKVWPLDKAKPEKVGGSGKVLAAETADEIAVKTGDLSLRFSKQSGLMISAQRGAQSFPLTNGPRMLGGTSQLASIACQAGANSVCIQTKYTGALQSADWTIGADGWVKLSYAYTLTGTNPCHGIGFDLPETSVKDMRWLGNGPYRVWQNRLAGNTFGIWTNSYNNTITGWSGWQYPEFKGFYQAPRWLQLGTSVGTITIEPCRVGYVQVLRPELPPGKLLAKSLVTFPEAGLAFLNAIPAIGNKFHSARETGPHAQPAIANGPFGGEVRFYFGKLPE